MVFKLDRLQGIGIYGIVSHGPQCIVITSNWICGQYRTEFKLGIKAVPCKPYTQMLGAVLTTV